MLIVLAVMLSAQSPVLSETPRPDAWTPLFNGKDLTGWEHVGPGHFSVESGLLRTYGGTGLLWFTPRKVGDAVIRVVYRTADKSSNSGVFIRIPERPTEPEMPINRGYEVQIDDSDDDYHTTGVLYSLTQALARPGRAGQWNTLEITLHGPRTRVSVNGVPVTDYTEGSPTPPKRESYEPDRGPRSEQGFIGIQNHWEGDVVDFKDISIRSLNARE